MPATNGNTEIRFVHGSADAGTVDVGIDSATVATNVTYGTVSKYFTENALAGGSHTIYVYPAGNDTTSSALATTSLTVAAGTAYSLVLAGEINPSSGSKSISVQTFAEQAYSTTGGFAAVNFHNASPAESAIVSPVPFGWAPINAPSSETPLGNAAFSSATGPQQLSSSANNTPLVLFAVGGFGSISVEPGQIDAADSQNILPFGADQNLTLYLIDGAGASKSPSSGASGGIGNFVGAFDANAL